MLKIATQKIFLLNMGRLNRVTSCCEFPKYFLVKRAFATGSSRENTGQRSATGKRSWLDDAKKKEPKSKEEKDERKAEAKQRAAKLKETQTKQIEARRKFIEAEKAKKDLLKAAEEKKPQTVPATPKKDANPRVVNTARSAVGSSANKSNLLQTEIRRQEEEIEEEQEELARGEEAVSKR